MTNAVDHWNDPPPADWTEEQIAAARAALPAKLDELSARGAIIIGPWWNIRELSPEEAGLCPCCGKILADCRCEHPQPPSPWE